MNALKDGTSPMTDGPAEPADMQKARALEFLLDAWERALKSGIEPEILASAAIFAALTDMVDLYGPEPVALMTADLPDRIRAGEFSFDADP